VNPGLLLSALAGAVAAALMGLAAPPVLRHLPTPAHPAPPGSGNRAPGARAPDTRAPDNQAPDTQGPEAPGPDDIPDYSALARVGWVAPLAIAAAVATALVVLVAPAPWLPLWLTWSSVLVLLAAIDAATTWLPLPLTRIAWLACALATVVALPLGAPIAQVGRVVTGAAICGLGYVVLWSVGRGLGFGDVRMAPMIGALGASLSWDAWWLAILAGSTLGALWGIGRHLTGRRGSYAYGPWLWVGPGVALAAAALVP